MAITRFQGGRFQSPHDDACASRTPILTEGSYGGRKQHDSTRIIAMTGAAHFRGRLAGNAHSEIAQRVSNLLVRELERRMSFSDLPRKMFKGRELKILECAAVDKLDFRNDFFGEV